MFGKAGSLSWSDSRLLTSLTPFLIFHLRGGLANPFIYAERGLILGMIDKADLDKMELHAVAGINENLSVLRVASGWIYLHYNIFFAVENNIRTRKAELTHTTFVPE